MADKFFSPFYSPFFLRQCSGGSFLSFPFDRGWKNTCILFPPPLSLAEFSSRRWGGIVGAFLSFFPRPWAGMHLPLPPKKRKQIAVDSENVDGSPSPSPLFPFPPLPLHASGLSFPKFFSRLSMNRSLCDRSPPPFFFPLSPSFPLHLIDVLPQPFFLSLFNGYIAESIYFHNS